MKNGDLQPAENSPMLTTDLNPGDPPTDLPPEVVRVVMRLQRLDVQATEIARFAAEVQAWAATGVWR
ncbi:MAG TPA: hypothetical protein VJU82_12095 [Acidobacteriaceae bacterium]|nr:hypothetical protein [Acidobacteriaceae bacterium]